MMNTKTKNTLILIIAVVVGWFGGALINANIIDLGIFIYPIEGYDGEDMEYLAKVMPTLPPKSFIFPFLAHSLGTLIGAIIAGLIVVRRNKIRAALIVGVLFLFAGIAVNIFIPGPIWFAITDIVLAYIPMAWIGGKIVLKLSKNN